MKLLIIAVGAKMPAWVDTAFADYAKRLPTDYQLDLKEIKPEPRTNGKTAAQMMSAEAKRIETALPTDSLIFALDERGKDLTSHDLAKQMQKWHTESRTVTLIIGGPDGLAPELKQRCHGMLRLSSLTLPHAMVRVLLAEQLYRAWSILHNHPYHRD